MEIDEMNFPLIRLRLALPFLLALADPTLAQEPSRVTILYDAFGPQSALKKDRGLSSLVEYGGKRILFDTGNNGAIFAQNVKELRADLAKLDAVVISHRHGDHTSGLNHLLSVNPGVEIYTPFEGAFFKSPLNKAFLERAKDLPPNLRYFDGQSPGLNSGTQLEKGNFQIIRQTTESFPGFFVLTTRSEKPGTIEMNEVSLAIRTPKGLAVVVGCPHPGVEKILENAANIDPKIYTVTGGFHLVLTPQEEIQRVAGILRDTLKVERVAPGHCTSERGFAVFMDKFKKRFDAPGVGAVIALPGAAQSTRQTYQAGSG
jgi:7,8-dihydropterin-6-yl-methyl-4-(beta-D-ribofuranosyl)aminobenzene 5'-phosphate synthase